jgi:sugar transferase (PEP-CTERM system associated)
MFKIGGQTVPLKALFLVVSDSCLIAFGILLAATIRFHEVEGLTAYLSSRESAIRFGLVLLVCQAAVYYYDLYDFQVVGRRTMLFVQSLQALGVSCLVLGAVYFFRPEISLGRGVAAIAAPIILFQLVAWRLLLEKTSEVLHPTERILVMGTGTAGISLVKEILRRPELHFKVVGFLDEKGENIGKSLVNPGIIGAAADVREIALKEAADRVVISLAERRGLMPVQQLLHLKFSGTKVEDAHSLYERLTGRILLEHLNPSWLILSDGFRKSKVTLALKRGVDIVAALLGLVVTAPLMVLTAIAIWLEDGKPVLFRQARVGLLGREFQMLKFRSMYHNPAGSTAWTSAGDRRITNVGKFIRRSRLDELPQLINVLRGDMSLVGPRPEQPYYVSLLEQQIPFYAQRHTVRPGCTGWAQVKFQYGASVEESKTKLEYDLFYIKHISAFLDLAIIFETFKVLLSGRGAK